jgi:hypothetical protein
MPYRYEKKTLTRYLSLSKFAAMLELGLFIPRASLFEDQLEGVLQFTSDATAPGSVACSDLKNLRDWIYVSCWYDDHHESHAMWQIYGNSHESVAIQTTTHDLTIASWSFPEKHHTLFDKVRYAVPGEVKDFEPAGVTVLVNHDQPQGFTASYATHSLFMKHKGYEFENEMRLVAIDPHASTTMRNPSPGKYLSVESSQKLIKKIFIHPLAPDWFEETVRRLTSRFGLSASVERSSLSHKHLVAN